MLDFTCSFKIAGSSLVNIDLFVLLSEWAFVLDLCIMKLIGKSPAPPMIGLGY